MRRLRQRKEACIFGSAIIESRGTKEQGQGDPADEMASLNWHTINNTASNPEVSELDGQQHSPSLTGFKQLVSKSRDAALQWPSR